MGYGEDQVRDLEATINNAECDAVVIGTPVDLTRIIRFNKPTVRIGYSLHETTRPDLGEILGTFLGRSEEPIILDEALI
jgi:predicted GTPase